jgi:hypothetical protein
MLRSIGTAVRSSLFDVACGARVVASMSPKFVTAGMVFPNH